jgi:iron(III) transport system substrate-binding protein
VRFHRRLVATLLFALLASVADASNRDIFLYRGADRAERLAAGAKQEGTLVLYSTMTLEDANPLLAAFEKKHAIKVKMWRAVNQKLVQRALAEARAGQLAADAFEGSGPGLEILHEEGLLEEFYSPAFADIPQEAFPRHRGYAPDNLLFTVMGYNTKLVPPGEVPASYEDLLAAKWRGKIGIESSNVAWFAAVVQAMGEEKGLAYFRALAASGPQVRSGHTLLTELVAAGEIPLALTVYNQAVDKLKEKGAPLAWKALQPAFGRADGIALAKSAQHPHAALLFADFVLSPEGQRFIKQASRVPVNRRVDTSFDKGEFRIIDLAALLKNWDKWESRWQSLFLRERR